MENKPRLLTLCRLHGGTDTKPMTFPTVLLKGRWLYNFGFASGDQVTITNTEPGSLVMSVTTPAAVRIPDKIRRKLENQINDCERKSRTS